MHMDFFLVLYAFGDSVQGRHAWFQLGLGLLK